MGSGITLRDISKQAGVSLATVSRVFSSNSPTPSATARKVLEVAEHLGYQTKKRDTDKTEQRLLALMVPRLRNPFYTDIIDGVQDVAARNGYSVIVAQSRSDNDSSGGTPAFISQNIVAGLITLDHLGHTKKLLQNVSPGLPIVQCCEYDDSLPYPSVAIDDYLAAFNAVNYLYTTGRRRIAIFNSTCASLYGSKREAGYRAALAQCGLPVREDWVYHLNIIDYNIAFAAAQELLSGDDIPDAVFAISDIYATAVIRAAGRVGLRVPQDIAIIGFDNTEIALMCDPPITTVNQPRYEIGCTACNILLSLIRGESTITQRLVISSDLIVRGST